MVSYKLVKENTPQAKGYTNTKFPKHYGLPVIAHVSVFNKEKNVYERRTIRHCTGETSIFLDEQSKDATPTKDEITFDEGWLTVDERNNPNTAAYLELLDSNGSKKNRNTSFAIKFEKFDVSMKYDDAMEDQALKGSVLMEFMALPIEKKRALSHYMGKRTQGVKPSQWTYELLSIVNASKQSASKFLKDIQDPILDKIDIISRAENMDILEYDNFRWNLQDVEVMKVDRTQNPHMEMAQFLSDNPETWANIQSKVVKTNKALVKDDSDDEEPVTKSQKEEGNFTETTFDAETMFLDAVDSKKIEYEHGKGYLLIKLMKHIGKSKAKAIEAIAQDKTLRDALNK